MSDPRLIRFIAVAETHAKSRAATGTRELYLLDLRRWLAWCAERKHDPTRPSLHAATAFRDEMQAKFAPLTVRRILNALSSMYGAAVNQERPVASWNPFLPKALPYPPATAYNQTEAVADNVADAILAAAADVPRDAAMLWLLCETGLRRASIAALRKDHIIRRGDSCIARVTVKGGKVRETAIPPGAAAALDRWLKLAPSATRYVFPAAIGDDHIHPSAINKVLVRHAQAAGYKGIHPHQFRVSFITTALDRGVPLRDVQEAAHHASADTTQRYDRGRRGLGVADAVAAFRKERKGSGE